MSWRGLLLKRDAASPSLTDFSRFGLSHSWSWVTSWSLRGDRFAPRSGPAAAAAASRVRAASRMAAATMMKSRAQRSPD